MGVLASVINSIRKVSRYLRTSRKLLREQGAALNMAKQKIIMLLKGFFKGLLIQFGFYALILSVAVGSVGIVFQFFGFLFTSRVNYANKNEALLEFSQGSQEEMESWSRDLTDADIENMEEFSESFDEEEIKELQEFGGMVHPKKIPQYMKIEDESYKKNVTIKVPVETTEITNGRSKDSTKYVDYNLTRGDTAYPYRQWWQSVTVLDSINDTADIENDSEIIDNAKEVLNPLFTWADPKTLDYKKNDKYNKTSDLEEVEISTTTVTTEENLIDIRLLESEKTVSIGPYDNSSSYTTTTIEKTTRPLAYLNKVDTMFGTYEFEYEEKKEQTSSNSSSSNIETSVYSIMVDGKRELAEFTYHVTSERSYKYEFNTWELKRESKIYNERFYDFLVMSGISSTDDPWVMSYMAESLPQNHDFLEQYTDYLGFIEAINEYRHGNYQDEFFVGDFGDFVGGEFHFPLESYSRISSYFGYRVHPISGVRKFHAGIDLAANSGTNILAAADGTVTFSGLNGTLTSGYGYMVELNHGGNITTRYAHCLRLLVSNGQVVSKGQVIAKVGSTGSSTGAHLHFEVRKNGVPTDPLPWITGE